MQSHCSYFNSMHVTVGDGHAAGDHVGVPDGFHLDMQRFRRVVLNRHGCGEQTLLNLCSPCTRRTSWWCHQTGCRGRWGRTPPPAQSWRHTWRWSPRCQRRRWWRGCSFAAPPIYPPSAALRCTCAGGGGGGAARRREQGGHPGGIFPSLSHQIPW